MSTFLSNLDFYCTKSLPIPTDELYREQVRRRDEMDQQIVQAFGLDFLDEYAKLWWDIADWDLTDHFREGLRFGLCLAEELRFGALLG